jgi:hypothetical protein
VKDAKRNEGPGLPPGKWEDHFRTAGIRVEELAAARSAQARATILGNFLSQNQGREVPIQAGDRSGRARLCVAGGDGKPRRYYFEIAWDGPPQADSGGTRPADGPAELDDGLGPPAPEGPEAAPATLPAPPRDPESAPAESGGGEPTPDRGTSANQEAWG